MGTVKRTAVYRKRNAPPGAEFPALEGDEVRVPLVYGSEPEELLRRSAPMGFVLSHVECTRDDLPEIDDGRIIMPDGIQDGPWCYYPRRHEGALSFVAPLGRSLAKPAVCFSAGDGSAPAMRMMAELPRFYEIAQMARDLANAVQMDPTADPDNVTIARQIVADCDLVLGTLQEPRDFQKR